MKKNVGKIDRLTRLTVAGLLAVLLINGNIAFSSILGILAIIVAVIFTVTSLFSWCPLYSLFGLSTCPIKD